MFQPEPGDFLKAFLCSCSLAGWWHAHPPLSTLPETGESPSHLPLPSFALLASSTVCQVYLSVFSDPPFALPAPQPSSCLLEARASCPASPNCSLPCGVAGGASALLKGFCASPSVCLGSTVWGEMLKPVIVGSNPACRFTAGQAYFISRQSESLSVIIPH